MFVVIGRVYAESSLSLLADNDSRRACRENDGSCRKACARDGVGGGCACRGSTCRCFGFYLYLRYDVRTESVVLDDELAVSIGALIGNVLEAVFGNVIYEQLRGLLEELGQRNCHGNCLAGLNIGAVLGKSYVEGDSVAALNSFNGRFRLSLGLLGRCRAYCRFKLGLNGLFRVCRGELDLCAFKSGILRVDLNAYLAKFARVDCRGLA